MTYFIIFCHGFHAKSEKKRVYRNDILRKRCPPPLQAGEKQVFSGGVQCLSEYASGRAGLEWEQGE